MVSKKSQGRQPDTIRVMRLLDEAGGLSNATVRAELNLSDTRYNEIKKSLLEEEAIEKYRCRGGGVRLTSKGEKSLPKNPETPKSTVKAESGLYVPLVDYLTKQSEEDEIMSMAINTANLRVKGKWQNPDITQITFESYQYLRKSEVIVGTFEVKQWGRWDVGAVFESAAHRRFSHEASVVLEWPNGVDFSLSDTTFKLDELSRECRRFGLGLYTLRPYYASYRLYAHIEPTRHTPSDSAVEAWLEHLFSRLEKEAKRFEVLRAQVDG